MRLIDADALKEKKVYSLERHEKIVPVAEIDWMPTIDAVPVERIKKCLMEIADNQIANAPDECDSDNERRYKSGVWNGLQMAYEIVSQLVGNSKSNKDPLDTEKNTAGTNNIPLKW